MLDSRKILVAGDERDMRIYLSTVVDCGHSVVEQIDDDSLDLFAVQIEDWQSRVSLYLKLNVLMPLLKEYQGFTDDVIEVVWARVAGWHARKAGELIEAVWHYKSKAKIF